jgi:hypothetical protein
MEIDFFLSKKQMYEFTYFHPFISLIGLTFRTYTLYLRKVIKNRTFKSLFHRGSELNLGMEGKVVKGYESIKRCAADSGAAAVRGNEVGIKETLFERDYILFVVGCAR